MAPDDIIPEILLRVHPEDPASIVRSSAASKAWRRILADPAFSGRYRALHRRTTPVLGFFHNPIDKEAARFVPATTSSFCPPAADRYERHVLDCRHGRGVLYDHDSDSPTRDCFVVWDPITGDVHKIPDKMHGLAVNAAFVCTAGDGRCDDHRSCSGGPYIVAFASVHSEDDVVDASAMLYSSETRKWSEDASIHVEPKRFDLEFDRPGTLVGDSFYFVCGSGALLRYWYAPVLKGHDYMLDAGIYEKHVLTVIKPPGVKQLGKVVVMAAEDGRLGLASLCRNKISQWARETVTDVGDDGVGWVRRRVIDLKTMLPLVNPKRRACLSGVNPEDANVIFISTEDGVFTIELETLQARKVSDMGSDVKVICPFVSFYTETLLQRLGSGKLPAPVAKQ